MIDDIPECPWCTGELNICFMCGEETDKPIAGLHGIICWSCALTAAAIVKLESAKC